MAMQSADYCDAVATYYAGDYEDLVDYINSCMRNDILITFINWIENSCTTVERGIYGETYG